MNVRREFRRHLALLSCSFPSHLAGKALKPPSRPQVTFPPHSPTLVLTPGRPQPSTFQLHVERFLNMKFYIHFLLRVDAHSFKFYLLNVLRIFLAK